MARQKGVFKVKGTMDDFSFYQSQDGYLVRMKGGVDAKRIKTDPAFARTRENGSEFGRAANRAKLLRTALRSLINKAKDGRVSSRLQQSMMKVLQSDTVQNRGARDFADGDIGLLKGFDFNINAKLGSTLFFPYSVAVDRVAGEAKIIVPDFVATVDVLIPGGSTHLKLIAGTSEVNPSTLEYISQVTETAWIAVDATTTPAADLVMPLTANTTDHVYVVLGVEFGQEVNGTTYVLKNGAFNALGIVEAGKV